MAKRAMYTGSNGISTGNIVWLSATKAVVPVAFQNGVSPAYWSVRLYVTNDAGVSWSEVSGSSAQTSAIYGYGYDSLPSGYHAAGRDSNNNIYYLAFSKLYKFTKGTGDTWTGAYMGDTGIGTASQFSLNVLGVDSLVVYYKGVGNITVKTSTNGGASWSHSTISNALFYRAEVVVSGALQSFYTTDIGGGDYSKSQGDFSGYASTFRPKAAQLGATNDGRLHLIYSDNAGNWKHQIKTGSTWSAESTIATYAEAIVDPDGYGPGNNYSARSMNTYPVLISDGAGLVFFWTEYDSDTDTYSAYVIGYNGVSWSSPVTVFSSLARLSSGMQAFALIGPYNRSSFGVAALQTWETASATPYIYTYSVDYAPLQPSGLSPSGGTAVGTVEPTVSWNFNSNVPGDAQTAYQVEVYRQSDSQLMHDSGKVTSSTRSFAVPSGASLSMGVFYQFRVKVWGSTDQASEWSSLALFKTSTPPTVSITSPADEGTVSSDTPQIEWNYADTESTTQSGYRVRILSFVTQTELYNSGQITSSAGYHQIPSGILQNGSTYYVEVRVTDGDGINSSVNTHEFDVDFIAPPNPDIDVEVGEKASVTVSVDISPPDDDAWMVDTIRIYKRKTT